MNQLNKLGITVGKDNKAEAIFNSLFPDFLSISYNTPSDYINKCWAVFQNHSYNNNNLNG